MKSISSAKAIIVLMATLAAATINSISAQDQSILAAASTLPAGVAPDSPLAEVIKLVQAGVDVSTIRSFIAAAPAPFNLDVDKILFLKDEGVPSDLINAMLDRDKAFYASAMNPSSAPTPGTITPVATATTDSAVPDTAPPTQDASMDSFQNTLAPYGTWVTVDGYGQCWRPTVVVYDSAWRPYGTRGHWTYTDYGWYWDSDYAWGITFHYGRWFRHAQLGWCWYPDTTWAPSWVTWRSSNDYCGWAPLPPFADFSPGVGFRYRGAMVGMNFDFGLDADCFVFLAPGHLCDRRPDHYFEKREQVTRIYRQTAIFNNFSVNSHTLVNRGIAVDHIAAAAHHAIVPVHMESLPNATRQGWHGDRSPRTPALGNPQDNNRSGAMNNHNGAGPGPATGNQFHAAPEAVTHINNNSETLHNETRAPVVQGSPMETHPLQIQSHSQPAGNTFSQPHNSSSGSPQPAFTHAEGPNAASHANSLPPQPSGAPIQGVHSINNNSSVAGASVQHGGTQLQQHQVTPSAPQAFGGSSAQNHVPPAPSAGSTPAAQPPQHPATGNASGGNNNSSNGANNGTNRGQNRQNQ